MRRDQLDKLLAFSALLTPGADILIVGSQGVLGVVPEDKLPAEALASVEADLTFLDGDEEKADLIDVMLGEDSDFHEQFNFYAQGVGIATAVLPAGWRDRLVPYPADLPGETRAWTPELHDLIAAKLVALREKDIAYTNALVIAGLVDLGILTERLKALPASVHADRVKTSLGLVEGWRSGHRPD